MNYNVQRPTSNVHFYNTLTKKKGTFNPLSEGRATIYSCGPTVYDQVHIGNLSAFIMADVLRRVLAASGYKVKHVMNFTDVDDKTIRRSKELYGGLPPLEALKKLTEACAASFLNDMKAIGNDTNALTFVKATDPETIAGMKELIARLHKEGFAYIADDGVYFSIGAYQKSGKKYGQLSEISSIGNTEARIQNDEYDKESAQDFALWKTQKEGEPAWDFTLDTHQLNGRPGWHIECSSMSSQNLGQPFDIHTGGIDLIFPHHENEIAQSTAGVENPIYANIFMHNEHVLVDGKKMSKSLGNFYTLEDIIKKGYEPLAFRLLVLQSHYRHQTNFSWKNLDAATQRLKRWRNLASLRWQAKDSLRDNDEQSIDEVSVRLFAAAEAALQALQDDLDTPQALKIIDEAFASLETSALLDIHEKALGQLLECIDETLGLQLLQTTPDIPDVQKQLIAERETAREAKAWQRSDLLRSQLTVEGIGVRDTPQGSVWYRTEFKS